MEKLTNLTGADMKKSENGEIKFEVNPRPVIVTAPTTIVAYWLYFSAFGGLNDRKIVSTLIKIVKILNI